MTTHCISFAIGNFCSGKTQSGFTLMELLLVVFILSALALTSTAFVDNQDDQFRFDDTRRRLELIRQAVVGHDPRTTVANGYVAENGILASSIGNLLDASPAGFTNSAAQQPVFDATPNSSSGYDDGVDVQTLTGDAERLLKGWRVGYLHAQPGSAVFKDGWGHDWAAVVVAGELKVTSPAKNGVFNAADTGYDKDMEDKVLQSNWSSTVAGLTVLIRNQSGIDYVGRLRASLLVFENSGTGARWKRYTSDALTCLDGTGNGLVDHDNNVGTPEVPCGHEAMLTFPLGGYPHTGVGYSDTRVPLGRHLLVLVRDPDGTAHSLDDAPYPGAATPVSRQIVCSAAGCPLETLVLK